MEQFILWDVVIRIQFLQTKNISLDKKESIMRKSRRYWWSLPFIFLLTAGALLWTNRAESTDFYASISKNLNVLGLIYKEVSRQYVDTVDPEKFFRAGIDGMLNTLDPYTTYIDEEDKSQLQIITEGQYGGVGLLLTNRNNMVTVGEPPFLGTPAYRAGIREGDIIIKVDNVFTKDVTFDETARLVRGTPGTEVRLTIQREGELKLLEFTLVREQIKVDDVRYSGFIDEGIGYILLTRFSKNAASEVSQAIYDLKKANLKGLVLDLRSNPGGVLESAVRIADLFLPKNSLIVSTRGRESSSVQEFKSTLEPVYGEGPLVVLVNRFSASASEIVAGAIQDHDRGVILGDTTFGKGLVQTVIPLTQKTALKITTRKYYTPSGRCIQKQNYSTWEDSTRVDNSSVYRTDSKRAVFGGGGIAPDLTLSFDPVSDLVVDLNRKSLFFNFAVHYVNTRAPLDTNFQVDDKILDDFKKYLNEKSYEYHHPAETSLAALETEVVKKGYGSSIAKNIDLLQESLNEIKEDIFKNSINDMRHFLRIELASKFFGTKRGVEVGLKDDPVIKKALEVLSNKELYAHILIREK